jgi:membrane protein
LIRALRSAAAGFQTHRGLFLASGLSFNLLICLIPLLFFLVSLAGFVLSRQAAADAVLKQLGQLVPVYRDELHRILAQIIRRRGLTGLLGTATLLLFASQLFAALRLVLNDVFGFTQRRGHVHEMVKDLVLDMLKDLVLLFVMGLLFIASILITDLFGWLRVLVMAPAGIPPEWIRSVFVIIGLAADAALFFIAYRYFPYRKVPVGPALGGALLASVLWEGAKQLFRWYITSLGIYDKIYGPLGALVALSMFVYYSGIVFVLGAEFAAALRAGRSRSH